MFSKQYRQSLREKWLAERFPNTKEITLGLKRIFVMPTMTSAALLLALFVLLLMAINFQSSLIYGLAFWLLALIIISVFFTYRNLSEVTVRAIQASSCFSGEKAVFELEISCPEDHKKSAISVGWKFQDFTTIDLLNQNSVSIKLSHETLKRGIFKPERVSIFTTFPIGLVVAWSYASLEMQSIVYPTPLLQESSEDGLSLAEDAEQGKEIIRGSTDFSGVRQYQVGDSPKHIHWPSYAKTGEAYTKTFVDYANQDLWLEWDSLALKGIETKLSHLCAKVLQYHQDHQIYGLKIPGKTIQPSSGEAHKTICLTALALYGIS